jgi:2-keto-3-deoxy-L-rhamnonate aldolase RhmA
MIHGENRIRRKIEEGGIALGFVCRSLSPVVVEMIGLAGFDFVWIDMEHAPADFSTVEHLCRAADAVDLESLVRLPNCDAANVLRALEAGAGIVNAPSVEDPSEAAALVRAAKYFPEGQRGSCSNSRGNRYGLKGNEAETFAAANRRVMTMIQIESKRGVERSEEICSVPGLDIVFVGLSDLSQSLGIPGQLDSPLLLTQADSVLQAARARGKTAAMMAANSAAAKNWLAQGVRIICCGVDVASIGKTLTGIRKEFESLGD